MAYIERRTGEEGTHYRVRIRLKGHPSTSATFRRRTDAKRWAQQAEAAIREGRYFKAPRSDDRTLEDLVDRYVREVLPTRSKGRKKLTALLTRWCEELGSISLAEIAPAQIAEVRDRLRDELTNRGRRRSPATVNRYLGALSHAFTVAVREWGWLEENPVFKVRRLTEPRGRVRFLSDEEREELLEVCRTDDDPRLYVLVLMALSTGARAGELLKLKWRDVDLDRGVAIAHDTKNGERRALAIRGKALDALTEWSRRQTNHQLVFANRTGKAVFPRKRWNAALEAAGVANFRFHDLRHSAASYLAMSGATLAEIAEILGHKTLAMVKRYSHLTDSHAHSVVERMNSKFI